MILDNPKALAAYTGGDIDAQMVPMDQSSLRQYVLSLNTEVLTIDRRILPLETIKEQGMEFLANGPGFLVDFLRWIFESLPFLGNIIAKMMGYRDIDDANKGLDDELRQRKSLGVLREFGRVTEVTGAVRDGKHMGKIELLK